MDHEGGRRGYEGDKAKTKAAAWPQQTQHAKQVPYGPPNQQRPHSKPPQEPPQHWPQHDASMAVQGDHTETAAEMKHSETAARIWSKHSSGSTQHGSHKTVDGGTGDKSKHEAAAEIETPLREVHALHDTALHGVPETSAGITTQGTADLKHTRSNVSAQHEGAVNMENVLLKMRALQIENADLRAKSNHQESTRLEGRDTFGPYQLYDMVRLPNGSTGMIVPMDFCKVITDVSCDIDSPDIEYIETSKLKPFGTCTQDSEDTKDYLGRTVKCGDRVCIADGLQMSRHATVLHIHGNLLWIRTDDNAVYTARGRQLRQLEVPHGGTQRDCNSDVVRGATNKFVEAQRKNMPPSPPPEVVEVHNAAVFAAQVMDTPTSPPSQLPSTSAQQATAGAEENRSVEPKPCSGGPIAVADNRATPKTLRQGWR